MDHFETFQTILTTCIETTFPQVDNVQAKCHPCAPPASSTVEVVFASIGFASQGVRGTLLLHVTRDRARAIRPIELEGTAEEVDCDVIGESANMLVGAFKNQLLRRGVALMIGTPLTTIACTVRTLASSESTSSTWFRVDQLAEPLYVRLDACFEPDFELGAAPDSKRSAGAEGDVLFF